MSTDPRSNARYLCTNQSHCWFCPMKKSMSEERTGQSREQNLKYGYDTGKLPDELNVPVVTAIGPGHISTSIILIDEVIPTNVHA